MLIDPRLPRLILGSAVGIALMSPAVSQEPGTGPRSRPPEMPLVFIENKGQWPDPVAFRARRGAFTAWFHDRGWTMTVHEVAGKTVRGVHARLTFEAARDSRPAGTGRQRATSSFFRGRDKTRWVTGAAHYDRIRFDDLYDGIDVAVRTAAGRPEYDILLEPTADLDQIVVRCDGFDDLEVAADGSLLIHGAHGAVQQTAPKTWYVEADGARRPVECRFRRIDAQRYGFAIEEVIEGLPLVIDPGFVWSTYFGGDGPDDRVYCVQRGPDGQVIASGSTNSTDFPTTMGSYSEGPIGARDAWVAVFDPTASGALQLVSSIRRTIREGLANAAISPVTYGGGYGEMDGMRRPAFPSHGVLPATVRTVRICAGGRPQGNAVQLRQVED